MTIRCRQCSGKHLTITCPLRTPEDKPRPWKQQQDQFFEEEERKPFKCSIKLHPGKEARVCSDTVDDFWADARFAASRSIYRDFVGVRKKGSETLYPQDFALLDPGQYDVVSRTHSLSNQDLFLVLDDAVSKLNEERPLAKEVVQKVQTELLLLFTHFSLSHEGNSLDIDETRMMTSVLAGKDWKRTIEEDDVGAEARSIDRPENDLKEAINHILVSERLQEIAKDCCVTETLVLQLHSWIMSGLLEKADEGLPGEYRKVPIGIEGSSFGRAPFEDAPPLMKRFFEITTTEREGEHLIDYLSRIHGEFQYIHPFRDGNGRIGRLIMNLFLMKQGFPILVLPTSMSTMFNHALEMGHRGNRTLFARLLGESIFHSLQIYEDALGVKLLPTIEETITNLKVADAPVPISP